ncbi:MAG: hypothetical protein ABMA64_07040 [Myxococcota bacterium]
MTPAGPDLCALYPTSRSVEDLAEPFRGCVSAFLLALRARGATVRISATRRPRERALLMRVAWDVAHGLVEPEEAPETPVPVSWTREGARSMVAAYKLVHRPSLSSRHITGTAIDMTISGWPGTEAELHAMGALHGVRKLVSDPPHWSIDGR